MRVLSLFDQSTASLSAGGVPPLVRSLILMVHGGRDPCLKQLESFSGMPVLVNTVNGPAASLQSL